MTGQGLLTDFLKRADKNSNDTEYRALALIWLDDIVKDIQNRQTTFHWRFLEKTATTPTVAEQHTYDLPSDIDTNKLMTVYDRTNDITYRFMPYSRFVRRVADPSSNIGRATIWTFYGNTLRLFPVPSSVITIFLDYIKIMPDATDNATTLDIPDKYKNIVINGLMMKAVQFDPDMGDARVQTALYEAQVNRMITDNSQMPAEIARPTSHRERWIRRRDIDGKNSFFFPLADENF